MAIDETFLRVARERFTPHHRGSGTEHVAFLLYSLVRMSKPRSIVEYGSGYTTLFMLTALADNVADEIDERAALHAKTIAAHEIGDIDPIWDDPRVAPWFGGGEKASMVNPAYYLERHCPHLFSFEVLEASHEYAGRMREAAATLGLETLLTSISGTTPSLDVLPPRAFPIDLAWNDDRDYFTFFEICWPQLNPRGGLLIFHNTASVPGFWKDIQRMREARAEAGDLEMITVEEPHKLVQNSCTILRRTTEFKPPFLTKGSAPTIFASLRQFRRMDAAASDIFTGIYERNLWSDRQSASGTGSNLTETEEVRRVLPDLLTDLRCRTLLDVPCGDFFWMKEVDLPVDYVGGDVVPALVAHNRERYVNDRRRFEQLDLTRDPLPDADVILCRDCLTHFSNEDVWRALRNIKRSTAQYLITTTFPTQSEFPDIATGGWRPLNLQGPPFCLPAPARVIAEGCPYPRYRDKSLGVWPIAALPA
jgi:predicted O-methyltransferase YrrM